MQDNTQIRENSVHDWTKKVEVSLDYFGQHTPSTTTADIMPRRDEYGITNLKRRVMVKYVHIPIPRINVAPQCKENHRKAFFA
jgi:hypothetical protein